MQNLIHSPYSHTSCKHSYQTKKKEVAQSKGASAQKASPNLHLVSFFSNASYQI